jgi:hypothetical protein
MEGRIGGGKVEVGRGRAKCGEREDGRTMKLMVSRKFGKILLLFGIVGKN